MEDEYICFGMVFTELHRPDACAGADIEYAVHLGVWLVWRSEAQRIVEGEEEQVVLQVYAIAS